jgi:hypothetical protein
MELIIKYGKKFEISRIKSTLGKLDWYKVHGYKPILPKDVETEEQIIRFIEESFDEEEYEKKKKRLFQEFKKIKKSFVESLRGFFSNVPKDIEVLLTKYGVGGSYSVPNRVIINIQAYKPTIEILKHEILHLLSEEEIIRRKLSHEEKEEFIKNLEKEIKLSSL